MSAWFTILAQFSVLAYALVGGVFLAFSDFIMRSLARTSGTGGAEAMQIINREVFRWIFMTLFLGMAVISIAIFVYALTHLGDPGAGMIAASAIAYLVGCFGVTVARNVPMNEALARMDLSLSTTQTYWDETYVPRWTFWNAVRTIACATSSALLLFALSSTS